MILRDINRTFPAHDFFKETGGLGQDSLYRISKAYAVHDEEVGYCQGLSFLVASLLLHVSNCYKVLQKRIVGADDYSSLQMIYCKFCKISIN